MHVAEIHRYPVKGLSAERLDSVTVQTAETLPFDRAFAIENGPSGFDPARPVTLPKIHFLMLMRNESLAALATHFNDATCTLTIRRDGEVVAEGRLDTADGRAAIETYIATYAAPDLRGPPRVLSAPGFSFSDVPAKVVSLINLETVRAIGRDFGIAVHPLRFRGNLHVEGMPAWDEFALVGKTIRIGTTTLEGVKRIERCAATNVNPETASRDMTIPRDLMRAYRHADCGVYFRVANGGTIKAGDVITPA